MDDIKAAIQIDIDELIDKLKEMKEEDYATVKLEVVGDEYCQELNLYAVSFDEDEPTMYGSITEQDCEYF